MGARKALGMDESVNKAVGREIKKLKAAYRQESPVTDKLVEPAPKPAAAPKPPEAPAPPVAAPEPPAGAAPAPAPAPKIKIGDKEYTPEELQAKFAESEAARAPAPAPAPEPEAPQGPAPLTAEEVAARENNFIETTAAGLDVPFSEEQMDTILAGGKPAVELMTGLRKQDMARAILLARKGVAQSLDPIMQQIFASMRPLVENHQMITRYSVEQQFLAKHKDFVPHIATARQVAEELLKRYPQQVERMSHEQFIDEVARQTDGLLTSEYKRWFPASAGTWRNGGNIVPAVPVAPVAASVPGPAPSTGTAPPPPPVPHVATRPPVPNAPVGNTGGITPDWRKSVAASLR